MEKLSVEEIVDIWSRWERKAGESFIDYFLDDNIHNMAIIVGYFVGKFPKLGNYILKHSDNTIPWEFIQDVPYDRNLKSLSELVEDFYEYETWDDELKGYVENYENYEKIMFAWSSLIHDVDVYYERFEEYVEENDIKNFIKE